jgi:hypothetical protein
MWSSDYHFRFAQGGFYLGYVQLAEVEDAGGEYRVRARGDCGGEVGDVACAA